MGAWQVRNQLFFGVSDGGEGLEFLAHEGWVHEFLELCAEWVEGAAAGVEGVLEEVGGAVGDEGFLALEGEAAEAAGGEGGLEVAPADVVGDVLFAGLLENVGCHAVLAVAAGGALGGVFGEGGPGFAVVEGDEGAVPGLAGDALGEGEGAGGEIDGVAFGGGGGELGEPG